MRWNVKNSASLFPCRALLLASLLGASSAAVSLTASSAHAQDAEELAQARAKFQKAIELKHGKNWGAALKLFRDVGQVKMTPQVRYHIATCEEGLGQLVAALGGYELAMAQSEGMAEGFIEEVQGAIDELKARIPKLVIERGEGAEAAAFELDGVQLGNSSIGGEMPLDPGPHTVTATSPGYENYRETVTVKEGGVEVLQVELVELDEGAAQPVVSDGGAKEEAKPLTFGILPYVVGGAGLAVAGVGGVFLGLSTGKSGEVKDLCGGTDCRSLTGGDVQTAKDLDKSATTFEAIGWIGVGVGVLALAGGTTMFFLDEGASASEEAALTWLPHAPNSDAGFSFVGQF